MNPLARTNGGLLRRGAVLALLAAAWIYASADSSAQEKGPPAAEEAAAAPMPPGAEDDSQGAGQESLGQLILKSQWFGVVFYVVLGIFSVAAFAVTLERLLHLRHNRIVPGRFVKGLRDLLALDEATPGNLRGLCDGSPSPIARILTAGLLRAGRPLPEVEKAMEDAAAREMAEMRSRNRPLNVVGSVAPLVGLLGTVVGMIFAFRVSSQAGLGKAELLAEGIYLALMTTAAGLTIAIPSLLCGAWFNAKAERYLREIDECLLETLPFFTKLEKSTAGGEFTPETMATAGGKP